MARVLTIGQVAKATGVASKTIRYYEAIGVLPAPGRTVSGYRRYDAPGVQRVRFIGRARALGLPLRRLKPLMAAQNGGPRPVTRPRLLALVRDQLGAVNRQMTELRALHRELERILRRPRPSARDRRARGCRCLDVESPRAT